MTDIPDEVMAKARDCLPASHTILEQSDMLDGRVSQTVKIMPSGEEYERIVSAEEAYGPGEGE